MAEPARTLSQPHERISRLQTLGLSEAQVDEAVSRGLSARQSTDRLHPPSFPGVYQWAATHHGFRDETAGAGWKPNDEANFSTTVSPDGATAVTVATGDQFTGTRGPRQPSTKYPRGSQTQLAIKTNRGTLPLFNDPLHVEASDPSRVTWVLLVHTDHQRGEVRYELSCPEAQDADGRVTSWAERIIFPPLEIKAEQLPGDDDEGAQDFDVPVDRL